MANKHLLLLILLALPVLSQNLLQNTSTNSVFNSNTNPISITYSSSNLQLNLITNTTDIFLIPNQHHYSQVSNSVYTIKIDEDVSISNKANNISLQLDYYSSTLVWPNNCLFNGLTNAPSLVSGKSYDISFDRKMAGNKWRVSIGNSSDIEGVNIPDYFTITFLTGTIPTNIVLGTSYTGPASSRLALYDPGNGVWQYYSANNLPVVGRAVRFSGDWRTSSGTYNSMFRETFNSLEYTCEFSGAFEKYPSHDNAYREMFFNATSVTAIHNNPIPNVIGTTGGNMFLYTFYNMSKVTSLPENFLNASGLTGTPAGSVFYGTCLGMGGVTNAYDFQLGSGITFDSTNVVTITSMCQNMGKWKGNVMWGTNVLVNAIPVPKTDINSFANCINMPNYNTINANWK